MVEFEFPKKLTTGKLMEAKAILDLPQYKYLSSFEETRLKKVCALLGVRDDLRDVSEVANEEFALKFVLDPAGGSHFAVSAEIGAYTMRSSQGTPLRLWVRIESVAPIPFPKPEQRNSVGGDPEEQTYGGELSRLKVRLKRRLLERFVNRLFQDGRRASLRERLNLLGGFGISGHFAWLESVENIEEFLDYPIPQFPFVKQLDFEHGVSRLQELIQNLPSSSDGRVNASANLDKLVKSNLLHRADKDRIRCLYANRNTMTHGIRRFEERNGEAILVLRNPRNSHTVEITHTNLDGLLSELESISNLVNNEIFAGGGTPTPNPRNEEWRNFRARRRY